jgi:hypothetical protein
MALDWFRRHQKKFLAFLTAFLMVTWGFGYYLQDLFRPRRTAGTISGSRVREADFNEFSQRWKAAFFGQEREIRGLTDILWRQFVLVHEAERLGLDVSHADVESFIKESLGGEGQFTEGAYNQFLRARNIPNQVYEQAIRERILTMKLIGFIRDQVTISNTEVWERYCRDNEKLKIKYLAFKPEYFVPTISVTDEQIKKFYDEHKNDIPDPANGVVGYKSKESVQAEVLIARYSDLEKLAKIPEKDIKDYYDDHKESYKIEPKKEEPKKDEAKKEETKKEEPKKTDQPAAVKAQPAKPQEAKPSDAAATKPAAAKEAKPSETKATPEKPKAVEAKPASAKATAGKPAPAYKPFEEVKDQIRAKFAKQEALRSAKTLIQKADDAIMTQLDQSDHADFSKIGQALAKEGLSYVKTPFFTREEENVAGISGLPGAALDRDSWKPSKTLEAPEGRYIFQVIARNPSQVQPLSAVHEEVEKDLKADLALKKAVELAQRCQKIAAASGLEAALAAAQKELPNAPAAKPPSPATPEKTSKSGEQGKSPKEAAKAPQGLAIQESNYFTRPITYGGRELHQYYTGLGDDRPNVARDAFELQDKAVGLAIEEKGDKACYLIQVADRKAADPAEYQKTFLFHRQRYLAQKQAAVQQAWLEDLMKNAKLESRAERERPE